MNTLQYHLERLVLWIRGLFRRPNIYAADELTYRKRVLKLIDYFRGEQLSYLNEVLNTQFTNPAALKLQMSFSNVVRAVTTALCSTFKHGVIVTAKNPADQQIIDEMLDQTNFDSFVKTLEQMTFLTRTCFVKPIWINSESRMMLNILTPEYIEVIPRMDNPYEIDSIMYPKTISRYNEYMMPEGEFHYWSQTEYKVITDKQLTVPNQGNPENTNPYGIIPVCTFRMSYPIDGDFFTWPGEELINAQDALNVKLTQLNALIKYQSFGVPVFINAPSDLYGNVNLNVDVSKPLALRSNKDEPSDFKFVSPDAKISELQNAISQEYIRLFAFYGLDASEFVTSGDAQSAEAVRLANAKIDEYRTNTKQVFIPQLGKLIEIMTTIWNIHNPDRQISDAGVTIKVQASRVTFENTQDMITAINWQIANNYMSYVDALVLLQDDLTENDAQELLRKNAEINALYAPNKVAEPMQEPVEEIETETEAENTET